MGLRLSLLLMVVLISAAALFALLPWIKEGYDLTDLPRFIGMAAGLAIVAWLWWRVGRGGARIAGLAALALPLLVYSNLSFWLGFNYWYGRRLEGQTHIASLQATSIVWPGFEGPVGVRIEMELVHPKGLDVALLPPKIAMTELRELTAQQYFSFLSMVQHSSLVVPLFPAGRDAPRDVFRDSPTRLVYELYPSAMNQMENPQRVCLWKDFAEAKLDSNAAYLAASWYFITKGGASVDLSRQLSERIRTSDLFRSMTEEEWTAMLRRLEPAGLIRAGYNQCPESNQQSISQSCFCR
jgi:hypothetical protein